MLYLDIPYELKESVKKLGARWEPKFKKWYVEKEENYLDSLIIYCKTIAKFI